MRLEDGGFRRHARSPLGERSIVRERLLLFNSRHHLWDLYHDFNSQHHLLDLCHYSLCEEFLDDRTGLTRSAVSLFFVIVVYVVGNLHMFKGPTRRLQRVQRSFVLYRPWIPGEHRRGICAVECVAAHLRGFEEDSRSEVVFWIGEWSIEFAYHWHDVAHVHDHSPLSAPLRRY